MKKYIFYSIDCGGSTLDIVSWRYKQPKLWRSNEINAGNLDRKTLLKILNTLPLAKNIAITGGKSGFFPDRIGPYQLTKINEITAIGLGAMNFCNKKRLLVASLGTGTCFVGVTEKSRIEHLGGTGIGGGTFFALSKALLQTNNISEILSLYNNGDCRKVDLSVEEIIGGNLGHIPGHKTAANLAKLAPSNSRADIAGGIVNLVAQSIGLCAVMTARYFQAEQIILCGKLTKIRPLIEKIQETSQLYKINTVVADNATHLTAIGAGLAAQNQ